MRAISGSNEPLRRHGHSKLSKMAACRQLGFDVTGNSAIRSADPENPTLEPNMKHIGWPLRRYGHSRILGHMELHFGGRGGRRGSAMAPFERAMVVSCRLSIVTVALSAICGRMSPTLIRTRGGSIWAKISGCFPWSRPTMFGSAESEHPGLTNGEIS